MILGKMVIGSQYLIPIKIEATGFSMESNPWNVRCNVGAMSARCNTTKIDGAWYFIFDTTRLKAGRCFVVVEYSIPDENFASGYRVEVWQDELTYLEDKK